MKEGREEKKKREERSRSRTKVARIHAVADSARILIKCLLMREREKEHGKWSRPVR